MISDCQEKNVNLSSFLTVFWSEEEGLDIGSPRIVDVYIANNSHLHVYGYQIHVSF